MPKRTLLVTGASGHLGRLAAGLLVERGADTVVAASRVPERLADLGRRGAVLRRVDFEDPASLADAFRGVDRLLLVSTDAVERPGRRIAQHRAAIAAARAAGVRHVVYTSLTRPGPESPVLIAPDHRDTEAALAESGLGYTVLRNNVYADGLLDLLPRAVESGALVSAAGDGRVGYVTRADCARAAAAALADADDAARRTLDVTGPELLGHADIARIAARLVGRPIVHKPIDAETLRAGLLASGLPPRIAELVVSFQVAQARGTLAVVSDAVSALTGRPAQSVADFLAAHRSTLGA